MAGGLRQKLNVVLAMLGEPDVLLLDEPYQGLDLDSVQRFWELIWSWRHKGHAAIVASHAQDAIDRADGVIELGSPRVHHPAHRRDTLTHAFQKLDIRGRTELPAALAGRDSADGTHALA